MTVSELYKSVAQLGFEDTLEEDSRFFYAANRALLEVSAIRPETRVYLVNHQPMINKIKGAVFTPTEKTEELCYEATDVKSYYFEADGNGMLYIEKYDSSLDKWVKIGELELSANRAFVSYKGFIREGDAFVKGLVRLRFAGEYLYSVRNVCAYGHIYSDDPDDIPAYEPFTRYDISALVDDFLSLLSPPISDDEELRRLNQGFDVENGRVLLLPNVCRGVYKVNYRHRPTPIVRSDEVEEDNTVIDLDEELCALLPTLIASYVWVEDEPNMAQYYLSLYQLRAADIERRDKNEAPVAFKNLNGW